MCDVEKEVSQNEEPAQKTVEEQKEEAATPEEAKKDDASSQQQEEQGEEGPAEMCGEWKVVNEAALRQLPNEELIKVQSIQISDSDVRRSPALNEGEIMGYGGDARTVHEIFLRGLKLSNGSGPCLGWRPAADGDYTWLTYQQVLEHAQWVGSGIIAKGGSACQDQKVGIYANNRAEWAIIDKACAGFSMISVPLYDTLGEKAMVYIVKQCSIAFLFADTNKKVQMMLNSQKKGDIDSLKVIVLMEPVSDEVKTIATEVGVDVITYEDLKKVGQENLQEFVPPQKDDLYTICYTSGTTGNPKGVMLTHLNMTANVAGGLFVMERTEKVTKDDILLSYLPLAHILERELEICVHYVGARVGFFSGNIRKIMDDAVVLKPTIFPLVPRLMNKIYDKVWSAVSQSIIKRTLMNFAVNRKLSQLHRGRVSKNTIWDRIVFSKVQGMLGGNVRVVVTGAAPISVEVLNFMRCALGVPISEAYGATETAAGTSATLAGDFVGGNVGFTLPTNYIKLVDVEEKNYFAKDSKGEICMKGTNVFKGYYKDEENTTKAIDEDGWYHSGDIGQWLPNGALKIIDRKKNIFKLSQGEYIAPEKIEQICVLSSPVAQAFVYGHSLKSTLIAVVVADEDVLEQWCKSKGFSEKLEYKEICKNEKVNELVLADLEHVCRGGGLKSFEIPKKIIVTSEQFAVENDQLTPSMKNRRPQIFEAYEKELNNLYESLE